MSLSLLAHSPHLPSTPSSYLPGQGKIKVVFAGSRRSQTRERHSHLSCTPVLALYLVLASVKVACLTSLTLPPSPRQKRNNKRSIKLNSAALVIHSVQDSDCYWKIEPCVTPPALGTLARTIKLCAGTFAFRALPVYRFELFRPRVTVSSDGDPRTHMARFTYFRAQWHHVRL